MVRLTHLPALRMLLPFLCGILIGLFARYSVPIPLLLCLLLIFYGLYSNKRASGTLLLQQWQGLILHILLLLTGWSYAWIRVPANRADHYSRYIREDAQLEIRVQQSPEPKGKSHRMETAVHRIILDKDTISVSGKLLMYLRTDSAACSLPEWGDRLIVPMQLQLPREATNPGSFDYRKYLLRQGISHVAYYKPDDITYAGNTSVNPLYKWTGAIGDYLSAEITDAINAPEARAIGLALLIGNRSLLDPDITDRFATTGTMHILAVSGLHVGIIFLFFDTILGLLPIAYKRKYFKPIALIVIIWTYALMTGLSPSIFRAAIMFSFLSMGKPLGKHISSFNILAASALLLIIINPMMILQVGFQLSYTAILGILCFQPYLAKCWHPQHTVLRYIWSIVTVSLAAQIGTAPLSIFYFHQFPVYFLLSNIIAIPLSFITMCAGVVFCLTSAIPIVGMFTAKALELLLQIMHNSLSYMSDLPSAAVLHMHWAMWTVISIYGTLILLYCWLVGKQHLYLWLLQLSAIAILFFSGIEMIVYKRQPGLFVYDNKDATAIGFRHGNNSYLISNDSVAIDGAFSNNFAPSLQRRWTGNPAVLNIPAEHNAACMQVGGQHILIALHNNNDLPACEPDYIVIDGGKVPLQALMDRYSSATYILGSRCSRKQLEYLRAKLEGNGIAYYSIKDNGYADLSPSQHHHLSYGAEGR